ncbi:MAG: hypothetical protein ACKERG_00165 [Candidatus Hodgkinia cicadicola]
MPCSPPQSPPSRRPPLTQWKAEVGEGGRDVGKCRQAGEGDGGEARERRGGKEEMCVYVGGRRGKG